MLTRILLAPPLTEGALITLDAQQAHHLGRVLRLGPSSLLEVFDGLGNRFSATLEAPQPRELAARIGPRRPGLGEGPLRVTLAQCVSASEKMDWTIEKAVELGVSSIDPVQSERATVRLDARRAATRHDHWRRLIVSACCQCGRDTVPSLHEVRSIGLWLDERDSRRPGIVLDPTATTSLPQWSQAMLGDGAALDLLVGPESGLSPSELDRAQRAGLTPIWMGPRILRTETAGLAAIAVLQSIAGDLSGL